MKNIYLLGATGSIGRQTLALIDRYPNEFKVITLTARNRIDDLIMLIEKYNPQFVSVESKSDADMLSDRFSNIIFGYGKSSLVHAATFNPQDQNALVVNALVGISGLVPTIEAIKLKRNIALSNKETLVVGGSIVMPLAKANNVSIYPIDSEHSAIWQALNGELHETINKLIITASGGSFRDLSYQELHHVTKEDALNHPNWNMGNKITIDSATMMNKGFEIIEAHYLFDLPINKIEPIIHRESIIHSMVEFVDHSVIAQLSNHNMSLPIQYALFYSERKEAVIESLDFLKIRTLNFEPVNYQLYPCLELAINAIEIGGSMPTVLNSANEACVDLFLQDKIKFIEISQIIEEAMKSHHLIASPTLKDILAIDEEIKERLYLKYKE